MEKIVAVAAALAQAVEDREVAHYARRRKWSRTDTARWLDARSEQVLAWSRRRLPRAPGHSRAMGYWLKQFAPIVFDRVHGRLAAESSDDAREALFVEEVMR